MAEIRKMRGGNHEPDVARVSTDQQTILGDGTSDRPLRVADQIRTRGSGILTDGETILGDGTAGELIRANPDGIPVRTDGVTIVGDGTVAAPLAVGQVDIAVQTDGATILGDGTAGRPARVNLGSIPVRTDGETIRGDGTAGAPLSAVPASASTATDGVTILGDGTVDEPLRANPDGIPVRTDGATILGDGTAGSPLSAVQASVSAAATDGVTILGDGTVDEPIRVNLGSIPVHADGVTLLGDGTVGQPLHVPPSPPPQSASPLPASIHGSAFQSAGATVVLRGSNGLVVPSGSGTAQVFHSIALPSGTRLTRVTLRVTDNAGTPLQAHLGGENGTPLFASSPSPGDAGDHPLVLEPPGGLTLAANKSYFVDVINNAGNLGWVLHGMTIE